MTGRCCCCCVRWRACSISLISEAYNNSREQSKALLHEYRAQKIHEYFLWLNYKNAESRKHSEASWAYLHILRPLRQEEHEKQEKEETEKQFNEVYRTAHRELERKMESLFDNLETKMSEMQEQLELKSPGR